MNTWIILNKTFVKVSKLIRADVSIRVIRSLEVQVVLSVTIEFGCRHIHANHNLICVSSFTDGTLYQL